MSILDGVLSAVGNGAALSLTYVDMGGEATRERFWKYRNSFICWNGGMEEPVVMDDYCCTRDILPTVFNLFGLSYDSRLLTGRAETVLMLSRGLRLSEGTVAYIVIRAIELVSLPPDTGAPFLD